MASLQGPFKFNGKLGDVVGYELNGTTVVRTIGSMERTLNHPHSVQSRAEFKRITLDNKFFRDLFSRYLQELSRKQLNNAITPLFSSIRDLDVLPKGTRTVGNGLLTRGAIDLFKGFEFNESPGWIRYLLHADPKIDRENQAVLLDAFVPQFCIKSPRGASHCFLSSCVVRVDFGELTGEYVVSNTACIQLKDTKPLSISLVPERKLTGRGIYLLLLKVVFYERVNGIDYPLAGSGNGCMVVDAWHG